MKIAVPLEKQLGENRVALVPESIKKLSGAGVEICVETGAGDKAGIPDADYAAVGAKLVNRATLFQGADILCCVNRPEPDDYQRLQPNAVVIGFLKPLDDPAGLEPVVKSRLSAWIFQPGPNAVTMSSWPTNVPPAIIMPLTPSRGRNRDTVNV